MALRVVAGIIGAFFLLQAIQWIARPAVAAEALGMPLLDGIGRSTQIGDIAAFFFALGSLSLLGAYTQNPLWLRAAALLIGSAAALRTLAWLLQDAAFAGAFIAVEIATTGALLFLATRLAGAGDSASSAA